MKWLSVELRSERLMILLIPGFGYELCTDRKETLFLVSANQIKAPCYVMSHHICASCDQFYVVVYHVIGLAQSDQSFQCYIMSHHMLHNVPSYLCSCPIIFVYHVIGLVQ